MFHKILVGNDGSEGAKKALRIASDLAKRYEAELHAITVKEPALQHVDRGAAGKLQSQQETPDYMRTLTIDAGLVASAAGVRLTSHVIQGGHEVETIVTFAKEHRFDLLAIGFVGHSKIFGGDWGSTLHHLANLSPCTVLIVK